MTDNFRRNPKALAAALSIVAFAAFAGTAVAGECPANQMKPGSVTSGPDKPVGVTDTVIASIDLSAKGGEFKGQMMRMRKLVIEPGGIVPWHEHSVRPANIYVISGTIEEYRSTCAVPIVHMAGDVTAEFGKDLAHWWKNTSKEQVVLISADILKDEMAAKQMM